MMPPALATKSGAQTMPRSASWTAIASAASWLLAAPQTIGARRCGIVVWSSTPPSAHGASTSTSARSASLEGRSVAVVGLGRVGGKLARLLAGEGASLVVADVDEGKRALADELGARWTDPDSALIAEVDVLAPCALGGVLNDDTVPELHCRVVAGAANNQLAADAIAVQLADRAIVWAPDFVANAGGIINISVELEDTGYDAGRAEERVRGVSDTTRMVFEHADATGATTLAAAMEIARRRLAEAGAAAA